MIPVMIQQERFGRRKTLSFSLAAAAILLSCSAFANEASKNECGESSFYASLTQILAYLGMCFVGGAYSCMYLYTSELMPTPVRGNALAFCRLISKLFTVLVPFIVALGDVVSWLPFAILSSFGFIGAVTMWSMPETFGQPSFQSFAEVNVFYEKSGGGVEEMDLSGLNKK